MNRELLLKEEVRVLENIIEEKDCYINLLEQCLIDIGADIKEKIKTRFEPEKMKHVSIKFIDIDFHTTLAVPNHNCEVLERIERVLKNGEQ